MLCKAASIDASSSGTVVDKRVSLLGIIVHSSDAGDDETSFNVQSIVLKNGENGDIKYQAAFYAAAKGAWIGTTNDSINRPSSQGNFGGECILFDDSIWFEYGGVGHPGIFEAVDNIVFFYI